MANRSVKPTCEFGRQLVKREKELGITREQALVRIGCKSNQTYINWLRGQQPDPDWYPAFEKFFERRRWYILDWLGLLDKEEVSVLRSMLAWPNPVAGTAVSIGRAA